MSDRSGIDPASTDDSGAVALAFDLREVAGEARRAAALAQGEYLPQDTREHELGLAFHAAARAARLLEHLAPRIAKMDGGDAGVLLARDALETMGHARSALRDGQLLEDALALSSASSMFGDAAECIYGIADLAVLAGTGELDLFDAIVNAPRVADGQQSWLDE